MMLSLCSSLLLVTSQSDSCTAKLSLNSNLIPFSTTNLSCDSVWSSQNFILRYAQTRPGTWSFILSAPDNNAYISIGFSSNGRMVGTSAIAGWINSGGPGVVKQYYLGGTGSTDCPPDQGELTLVKESMMIISQSSNLYMVFQINTTAQPKTELIYAVGPKNRLPSSSSSGGYYLPQHKDMVSTSINYVNGQSSSGSSGRPYSTLRQGHGLLTLVGWGVLMPIGVTVARYFKHRDPTWFYVHISIQGIGFIIGMIGLITGFSLEDKLNVDVDTHKGLAVFILVLGCLQVMALLARPAKGAKLRKYWNWYHHYVGRVCIVVAVGNIFYGIHLGMESSSWNIGYGIVLALWVVVSVVLELRRCTSD
ncbi:hypothetical protein QJS10_CPB04g01907 [Acorus calamus]|uniref:Cytochrome b561 and DOMON domain-containing protein n=1 Tax=Acorus calamus TaxID=4465 RepID=A0AAV9EXD1_ACOCL|nr:hypothetical protein QJS10_CPB04g01907 [Acorus calamus]